MTKAELLEMTKDDPYDFESWHPFSDFSVDDVRQVCGVPVTTGCLLVQYETYRLADDRYIIVSMQGWCTAPSIEAADEMMVTDFEFWAEQAAGYRGRQLLAKYPSRILTPEVTECTQLVGAALEADRGWEARIHGTNLNLRAIKDDFTGKVTAYELIPPYSDC